MTRALKITALQCTVFILGFVPVLAGLNIILTQSATMDVSLDSHFRYLSGLLLAIGLGFWSTIPTIETKTARFRLLTFIVFIGGLSRLTGLLLIGVPNPAMLFGLGMELMVTPLLCWWQSTICTDRFES